MTITFCEIVDKFVLHDNWMTPALMRLVFSNYLVPSPSADSLYHPDNNDILMSHVRSAKKSATVRVIGEPFMIDVFVPAFPLPRVPRDPRAPRVLNNKIVAEELQRRGGLSTWYHMLEHFEDEVRQHGKVRLALHVNNVTLKEHLLKYTDTLRLVNTNWSIKTWRADATILAACAGTPEDIAYAVDAGASWAHRTLYHAALNKNIPCLQYAVERGASSSPWVSWNMPFGPKTSRETEAMNCVCRIVASEMVCRDLSTWLAQKGSMATVSVYDAHTVFVASEGDVRRRFLRLMFRAGESGILRRAHLSPTTDADIGVHVSRGTASRRRLFTSELDRAVLRAAGTLTRKRRKTVTACNKAAARGEVAIAADLLAEFNRATRATTLRRGKSVLVKWNGWQKVLMMWVPAAPCAVREVISAFLA